jgi:hypothetical protein
MALNFIMEGIVINNNSPDSAGFAASYLITELNKEAMLISKWSQVLKILPSRASVAISLKDPWFLVYQDCFGV